MRLYIARAQGGVSVRVVPDPVLMIYSIFPDDEQVADKWRERLQGNSYEHPLLGY